ncbi:hypothetical protein BKA82DRAFT_24361 [Pisolithus tinctorius]|uniref:Uncharacterized protein n=1 Tax=Pisolithus tinctorius Marx 270 TaxID=870435 RepID=A0A0C3JC29_PISTI|nr:hypothetical protein BKA82DRAFT_24361 [Pisolithus tinctorius]KIO06648.1 hypothetical protein M404DRAFT_24361 [Pisolithus tinctorius Marx 270]
MKVVAPDCAIMARKTGDYKVAVYQAIAQALIPEVANVFWHTAGDHIKKIEWLKDCYVKLAAKLKQTGGEVKDGEDPDTEENPNIFMYFYLPAKGPDENTPELACNVPAEIAKEAIAAMSLSLVHPGITGSLGSAAAVIPAPLRQLSAGPSQSIPGSPTGFSLNEDDVLMGMVSPHGRNTLDSAQVVGHSVNSTVLDVQNDHRPEFKTEFHPHSKRPTLFQSAEEFGQQNLKYMALDCEPWCPFALEGDYIFATVTMEAGLSSTQVDSLLKLIHCIWQGTASITLCNDAGLRTALDRAVAQLTPFLKFEIAAPYKGSDMMFPIHIRPLWDWALDLLQNPSLAPHFVWDAEWVFKLDGETYERFYTKPWTGNCWWDIQVPELAGEERKIGYVNFKHVIWHEAFYKLLEKVAELSKVGYLHECYNNIHQWLFPVILILSADYEELGELKAYQSCICRLHDTGLKDNWNFPKAHLWKHVTCDIQSKGAVCNYSAWLNEKMHGLLKDAYQDCSNRKDVAGQILHIDHHRFVIKLIQARIDAENEHVTHFTDDEDDNEPFEGNTRLGAPQQPSTLSENTHQDDRVFEGFHQRLEIFLNTCLPTYGYPLNVWI